MICMLPNLISLLTKYKWIQLGFLDLWFTPEPVLREWLEGARAQALERYPEQYLLRDLFAVDSFTFYWDLVLGKFTSSYNSKTETPKPTQSAFLSLSGCLHTECPGSQDIVNLVPKRVTHYLIENLFLYIVSLGYTYFVLASSLFLDCPSLLLNCPSSG